ncbi:MULTISPECIES: hypothetical protein [unclassified Paracoccus (in: a-proteobacteria)]|uniref:hypothetical protein n=1 Tax=unclassified Paracoccus (in: a-proteobacteria) TaxID=2688777 RepID=UPI0012B41E1C|nr:MULTISPECIES: hypothetical protein [unclassified Paracoccus (in: a-proteobacteria)]UXU75564.1 hypothetical protein GB879_003460 [Paracoccus sp. SMMA_5]UXU81468.1 hypothetical protein GB880_003450 [Paracoccus sp. SMMA_5_TC]
MTKKKLNAALRNFSESAFDFLEKSVDEIKDRPKYSVIHFATAVELLLKARLMREHWTLVAERASDVTLDNFLSGECKTVTQADAIRRLNGACGENIPKDAVAQFARIAAHRNQMIHFFHEAGTAKAGQAMIEGIVKEQCLSWYYLERLLSEWADQFEEFDTRIATIRWRMKQNRAFLSVAFDRLKPEIDAAKKAGAKFAACSGCGYEASAVTELSDIFFEKHCRLCGLGEAYLEIPCPADCGTTLHIKADHGSDRTCETCGHKVTAGELSDALDTEYSDPSDYEPQVNCAMCSSMGRVVQHHDTFICTECLSTDESAPQCGWCNERQIGGGDLEFSYHSGCEFCDGQAGWTKDD